MSNLLAIQDADGRPLVGQGYDNTTHQFTVPQTAPAVNDPVTQTPYAPLLDVPVDGYKASYSAAINGLVTVASATDIFTLTGSATKTIRILHVEVSGIATTAIDTTVRTLVRTTADTGGTSTAPVAVPHDQTNAAATAAVAAYTANPTVNDGTNRIIRAEKVLFNLVAPAAGSESGRLMLDFGVRPSQAIVLRGVAQQFAINLAGVTIAGPSVDISIEWTEE